MSGHSNKMHPGYFMKCLQTSLIHAIWGGSGGKIVMFRSWKSEYYVFKSLIYMCIPYHLWVWSCGQLHTLWVWSTAGLLFGGRTQPRGCNSSFFPKWWRKRGMDGWEWVWRCFKSLLAGRGRTALSCGEADSHNHHVADPHPLWALLLCVRSESCLGHMFRYGCWWLVCCQRRQRSSCSVLFVVVFSESLLYSVLHSNRMFYYYSWRWEWWWAASGQWLFISILSLCSLALLYLSYIIFCFSLFAVWNCLNCLSGYI